MSLLLEAATLTISLWRGSSPRPWEPFSATSPSCSSELGRRWTDSSLQVTETFLKAGAILYEWNFSLYIIAMAAFLPKYFESQFSLPPGDAAMLVGAIVVPAGAGGTLTGGYLAKRFKLNRAGK